MSDKLEALSQPIGQVTNQLDGAVIVESDQLLPGDNVYSQEYVTALLAALEEKDQRIANQVELAEQLGKSLDEANQTGQGWMDRTKAAEQILQQPIKLPDIRSEDYHESGWFQHMKYYRDVVRSIQVLELKVEGE